MQRGDELPVSGIFHSIDVPDAELFWQDESFGILPMEGEDPMRLNTFVGHAWTVHVDGQSVLEWKVQPNMKEQTFALRAQDILEYAASVNAGGGEDNEL
jgi:hypothetical protein